MASNLQIVLGSFFEVWSQGSIPRVKVTLIDPNNFPQKAEQSESVVGTRTDHPKREPLDPDPILGQAANESSSGAGTLGD